MASQSAFTTEYPHNLNSSNDEESEGLVLYDDGSGEVVEYDLVCSTSTLDMEAEVHQFLGEKMATISAGPSAPIYLPPSSLKQSEEDDGKVLQAITEGAETNSAVPARKRIDRDTSGITYTRIRDARVPPRARASLPPVLRLRGGRVFTRRRLPPHTLFGPVQGVQREVSAAEAAGLARAAAAEGRVVFLLADPERSATLHIDVSDENTSNWLRYVRLGAPGAATLRLRQLGRELCAVSERALPPDAALTLAYSPAYLADEWSADGAEGAWPCYECAARCRTPAELQAHLDTHDPPDVRGAAVRGRGRGRGRRRPPRCAPPCDRAFTRPLCARRIRTHQRPTLLPHPKQLKKRSKSDLPNPPTIYTPLETSEVTKNEKVEEDDKKSRVDYESDYIQDVVKRDIDVNNDIVENVSDDVEDANGILNNVEYDDNGGDEDYANEDTEDYVSSDIDIVKEDLEDYVNGAIDYMSVDAGDMNGDIEDFVLSDAEEDVNEEIEKVTGAAEDSGAGRGRDRQLVCTLCADRFPRSQYRAHTELHRAADNHFPCTYCNKRFSSYAAARKHVRAQHRTGLHECPHCGARFAELSACAKHVIRHTDEKRFICECGKAFKRKHKLKQHMVTKHPNGIVTKVELPVTKAVSDLPFVCPLCQSGFKRRGMLVNHVTRVHPHQPPGAVEALARPVMRARRDYRCTRCPRLYTSAAKRKLHFLRHHPGEPPPSARVAAGPARAPAPCAPHACAGCRRQYASRGRLNRHVREAHPELAPPAPTVARCRAVLPPDPPGLLPAHRRALTCPKGEGGVTPGAALSGAESYAAEALTCLRLPPPLHPPPPPHPARRAPRST